MGTRVLMESQFVAPKVIGIGPGTAGSERFVLKHKEFCDDIQA